MIVAIEGPCYAGKTTLARSIVRLLEYQYVAECVYYIPDRTFPVISHTTGDSLEATRFCHRIELQRQQDIRAALATGRSIVMDRSHWSVLAFDYARERLGGPAIWEHSERLFADTPLIVPERVFYLDPSPGAIASRQEAHPYDMPAILTDPRFNTELRRYFDTYVRARTSLHVIPADEPPDAVFARIVDGLSEP